MDVSTGERWEGFVDAALKSGRCGSASEIVDEGLRLVEERESKMQALRDTLHRSIAAGGAFADGEVAEAIDAEAAKLARSGF